MFKDFFEVIGYDLILSDKNNDRANFHIYSSCQRKKYMVDKCERVIEVGEFARIDLYDRQVPLINDPDEIDVVDKLCQENMKVI